MSQQIKNVMLIGASGLLGSHVFEALQSEASFHLSVLARKSSKATFPSHIKVYRIDDDSPLAQLVDAFKGQDALVSTLPGRPYEVHMRMIDAAVQAGVKRFIPSEYGNNTCNAASELVPLYGDKAKVLAHLKSQESTGLTWTAIQNGQFFDWGLDTGWLSYDLKSKKALIFDSGKTKWSTTTIGTVAAAVVKVLLKPEETKNRPVHIASFTVSQQQVLDALEKASGASWTTDTIASDAAMKMGQEIDRNGDSEGLRLSVLLLMYADDADRGGNFEETFSLDNEMLGLPVEHLSLVVERIVKQQQA
ncbi:hypothetical protein AAFC00_002726 [Neodothiora populina]|uniref:NmrA-like domain-containing protein n=1 Tax=Neodothiora populina TaxID=2781224 RepID=A0ABR3P8B4_9PEZI